MILTITFIYDIVSNKLHNLYEKQLFKTFDITTFYRIINKLIINVTKMPEFNLLFIECHMRSKVPGIFLIVSLDTTIRLLKSASLLY